MSRAFSPKVVTANDLLEGDVVYLTAQDGWTRHLREAEILRNETLATQRQTLAAQQAGAVVGVYLAEVRITASGPEPVHFREDFRRTGPSNYAHGKQAAPAR